MTDMHLATRKALYRRLQAANPEPTTELLYNTPFELLVAVMLSAHTTDKSVNAATRKLFPVANTPAALLKLGEEGVKPYLKTVGLYNAKTKNLVGLCKQLIEKHGGEVPPDREALEALPGVGRKTASVVLNMVFGQVEIAVDTHIFRVANRTGLAPGKTPFAVEIALMRNTPDEYKKNAHHWLLLHGRYVCVARVPACPKCIIKDLCEYPDKTQPPALKRSDAPIAHEKRHPMAGSGGERGGTSPAKATGASKSATPGSPPRRKPATRKRAPARMK
jgi:endonuclease III